MRSVRLVNVLAATSAAVAMGFVIYIRGHSVLYYPRLMLLLGIAVFAYSFLLLSYLGRFDPVVALAARAWQRADYESALFRLGLFSWRDRRAPFKAFLLTSANLADQAYSVATSARLSDTDMEEPTYDLDFALGRAALAMGDLGRAEQHFQSLKQRFPGSALARFALGDLLLWQNEGPVEAHELLTRALADADRNSLPHWTRLGFEAELHASLAWAVAAMGRLDALQINIDKAIALAGENRPVRGSVHLRLGHALSAAKHFGVARQHWIAARDIDPHGWAGAQAGSMLEIDRSSSSRSGQNVF